MTVLMTVFLFIHEHGPLLPVTHCLVFNIPIKYQVLNQFLSFLVNNNNADHFIIIAIHP